MAFNSYVYVLFLIAAVIIYYCLPKKIRWIELLCVNIIYYLISGLQYSLFFVFSIVTVYIAGRFITLQDQKFDMITQNLTREEQKEKKKAFAKYKKRIVVLTILLNLGILIFRKYFLFVLFNINRVFALLHISIQIPQISFALPLGISFYTLQAVGYLIDVGRGQYKAEKNFAKFVLFMTFFPHIIEGPICRYSQTASSLAEGHEFSKENFLFGIQRIGWGLFKKIVIADRLDILVNHIYANYKEYSGTLIIVVAVAYTTQLYAEFSGCMDIVIGSAQLFGITLPENFEHPFASKSIQEYWRRWHITLGKWFKDYVFYPVSLSAFSKKIARKLKSRYNNYLVKLTSTFIAVFVVWTLTGMWHGGSFRYLLYGWYYFFIIAAGLVIEPFVIQIREHFHIQEHSIIYVCFQRSRTFILIVIGLMIFRATTVTQFVNMFSSIFNGLTISVFFDGTMLKLGLDKMDFYLLFASVFLMIAVGTLQTRGIKIRQFVANQAIYIRWPIYYALIMSIIVFGAYGKGYTPVAFIYANF